MGDGFRVRPWLELIVITGIAGAALAISRESVSLPVPGLKQWLVPAVFLYAPIIAVLAAGREFQEIGLAAPPWKTAAADLAIFAGMILPVFLVSWWALFHYGFNARFSPGWPDQALGLFLWQLLGVALPEEVFFRGWLQTRLDRIIGRRRPLLGAAVGPGLFLSAALFALAHYLVSPNPIRLLVFFPGMLFGWFRERSGSVLVPVLAHALGNAAFLTLQLWAV